MRKLFISLLFLSFTFVLAENSKEYQLDSSNNGLDFKFKDLDVSIEFGESPDKQGVIEVSYFGKVKIYDISAGDASLRENF